MAVWIKNLPERGLFFLQSQEIDTGTTAVKMNGLTETNTDAGNYLLNELHTTSVGYDYGTACKGST